MHPSISSCDIRSGGPQRTGMTCLLLSEHGQTPRRHGDFASSSPCILAWLETLLDFAWRVILNAGLPLCCMKLSQAWSLTPFCCLAPSAGPLHDQDVCHSTGLSPLDALHCIESITRPCAPTCGRTASTSNPSDERKATRKCSCVQKCASSSK